MIYFGLLGNPVRRSVSGQLLERTFVRRQFMRGTDPIKSRWECLRIVMLVAMYVFEFFSSLIPTGY